MDAETDRWFGPGETGRRLGVTPKALRIYEREGLVVPHRAESGWRLYGPAQVARLHQIIVLRDLGLSLKSIQKLLGSQSRLHEVLRLQRESLEVQRAKIGRAIKLIEEAQHQLDSGRDLSLDDLATLTRETVVQQPTPMKEFEARMDTLVAERDPSGQASRAIEGLKEEIRSGILPETIGELKAMFAEVKRLREMGNVGSEAAKQLVRRWRAHSANIKRPTEAQREVIQGAYEAALAEAKAQPEPLPFDPETLAFVREVMRGMKERGELT